MLGYGCCCRPETTGPIFESSLHTYLDAGGRLIDTAAGYHNHGEVGRSVRRFISEGKATRQEIFITTKVAYPYGGYESTQAGILRLLSDLQMEYVDLLLMHHPQCTRKVMPGVPGKPCHDLSKAKAAEMGCLTGKALKSCLQRSWDALVDARKAGKARAIGVANFNEAQIEWLQEAGRPTPAVNQIAYNPLVPDKVHSLVRWCQSKGIAVTAFWSLNGHKGLPHRLSANSSLEHLAAKYHKSHAQVLLRWAIDRKVAVIPGSGSPGHIRANLNITDFCLVQSESSALEKAGKRETLGNKIPDKSVNKWGT